MRGLALVLIGCTVEPERWGAPGPCPEATTGAFTVLEVDGWVGFDGRAWADTEPGERVTTAASEECVIRERPACAGCSGDEVCGAAGCRPFPVAVDLGPVELAVDGRALHFEPIAPGALYTGTLDRPPPGADLALRVGDLGLDVTAVAALEPRSTTWSIGSGDALEVGWEPVQEGTGGVVARLAVDQHGASQGELRCRFADEGSGRIPAEAIAALVEAGVSGFPSASLTRETVAHGLLDGRCVTFAARSQVPVALEIR